MMHHGNWHLSKPRTFSLLDGSMDDSALLGVKGAHLCEMMRLKLPVPPGFIITTEASKDYYKTIENLMESVRFKVIDTLPEQLVEAYKASMQDLEIQTRRIFGKCVVKTNERDGSNIRSIPLLLALRCDSSFHAHHPSQAILNLGLNDAIVDWMAAHFSEPFALDCYRRFIQMFASLVYNVPKSTFDNISTSFLEKANKKTEIELDSGSFRSLIAAYKTVAVIPDDPWRQLELAVVGYYRWWFSDCSIAERTTSGVSKDQGIAIVIQSMVYGNANSKCGTGVCSTRCPVTGEKMLVGEFLVMSEG